jgi:hypothetical protein
MTDIADDYTEAVPRVGRPQGCCGVLLYCAGVSR